MAMVTPDLTQLRKDVKDLPNDFDKAELLRDLDALEEDCRRTDESVKQQRAEEEERNRQLKRKSFMVIPILLVVALGFAWYLTSALTDGYITHRKQVIYSSADPINFWFLLIWPAGGIVACLVGVAYLFRFAFVTTQITKR